MPKAIKWILAVLAALLVLLVAVIIIAPMLIDLNRFKPQIEGQIEKATGRPVTIGGPIEPTIFPWVGVALSDMHMGNPAGFKADDFVSVAAFEIRVKLLPLLSRNVKVKRFVMKDPEIVLIKKKDGAANWEGLGGDGAGSEPAKEKQPAGGLPIESLAVEEFAITNGQVTYIDQAADGRHEIKNINLTMDNFSLETPVAVAFSAIADNHPLSLTGTIGPLGSEPGKNPVALDLTARLIDEIAVHLKGRVQNAASAPEFDLTVEMDPFSPRQALDKLNQPLPLQTSDDQVLGKLAAAFVVSGSPQSVAIKDGRMTLDESQMTFSARAKDFDKPDVVLEAALDRIDLDRYLPPPPAKEEQPAEKETKPSPPGKPIDYTPLRTLVFDGRIKVGEMKAKNLRMQNIQVHASAKNGVIRLVPLNMDLYDGRLAAEGTVNVQQEKPRTRFKIDMGGVQAGPLLKDYLQKDLIAGVLNTDINLNFAGDQAEMIRRSLDGSGKLEFVDGAIIGIDLAAMVRNVQAAFGLAERPEEKPRTDFSEFVLPFSINSGKVAIQDSRLQSPLLRVQTQGTADLVQENLNLRVEPKFVGSLIGQGDTKQRSGIMVPVNVTGSFSDPKFKPDLKSMVRQLPETKALEEGAEKELEKTKQKAKDLLKGLPFGSKP